MSLIIWMRAHPWITASGAYFISVVAMFGYCMVSADRDHTEPV